VSRTPAESLKPVKTLPAEGLGDAHGNLTPLAGFAVAIVLRIGGMALRDAGLLVDRGAHEPVPDP
jgi:hypothetical protein